MMDTFQLEEIQDIRLINGIAFPESVEKSKLVVSGPPGSGKTTILNAIGGWPEEGYLDISSKEWWKSQALTNLPRELHFGLPFMGHESAVPVYDLKSLEDRSFLEVDLFNISLPPPKSGALSTDFRSRFIFEFIILSPNKIFAMRKKRADQGTHHVDKELVLKDVQEQVQHYQTLALFFHRSGMNVYIRDDLDGPPKRILEDKVTLAVSASSKTSDLYKKIDQMKLRQQILNRSWSLRGNKELLNFFVDFLPVALNAEACSVFIYEKATDQVWLVSGTDVGERDIEVPKEGSFVGEVISTGRPLVRRGMDKKQGIHSKVDKKTGFVTRTILGVPILSLTGKEVTGAICLLNKHGDADYTEEDEKILEKVAYHMETAIQNIFLRQDMMDFSELLTSHMSKAGARWKRVSWGLLAALILQFGVLFYLNGSQIMTILQNFAHPSG